MKKTYHIIFWELTFVEYVDVLKAYTKSYIYIVQFFSVILSTAQRGGG